MIIPIIWRIINVSLIFLVIDVLTYKIVKILLEKYYIQIWFLKWTILSSFLEICMEYFDDFIILIPKKTITWKIIHKEPN